MKKSYIIFLFFVIYVLSFLLYGIFEEKYFYRDYQYTDKFDENFYKIQGNMGQGIADSEGNIIVKPVYEDVWYYNSKYSSEFNIEDYLTSFLVYKKGKFGVINEQGNSLCLVKYDDIVSIDSIFYIIKKRNKYGLISYNGRVILPIKYDGIRLVKNGKLELKKGKRTIKLPFLGYDKKKT